MKFAKLYHDNRQAVESALTAMWCGESGNASQREYARLLQEEIKNIFAPRDAMPVVQCMNSYQSVHSVPATEAKALVGSLWKSTKFYPYEHQYQCWNALLNGQTEEGLPMSICVTTGTGSGKTECFMMPLVKNLIDLGKQDQVQALFLYPLNALMEDQKERLEELLEGTNLTYTVFNGDLPEREPAADDYSKSAELLRKRIKLIRGWDEEKCDYKFKHMLYTREMVRKNPPNILLTNPTMLEYILLRQKDVKLTNPSLKSLKWVAIDETHTYTGAGAAELAMLLRRVLLAFGVQASEVRFATSSATFGNGADPKEEERKLQKFIAGITGLYPQQVKVVGGKRIGEDCIPVGADGRIWRMLFEKEYVSLQELIKDGETIEEKLQIFDELCEHVPMQDGAPLLKAKIHYFYRIPNNGLFVRLTEHSDGAFKIYTMNNSQEDQKNNPLLELTRCKHCGEYVALARVNNIPGDDFGTYKALERDDSDMFDVVDDETGKSDTHLAIIGLSDKDNETGDNNVSMVALNGKLQSVMPGEIQNGEWHLVVNTKCKCPHCNSKLTKRKNSDEDVDSDIVEDADSAYLMKFRTSPEFISRVMAPSVLDNLEKVASEDSQKIILHDGQQYISFADSRQLAAKATMKQNIEQERDWLYSRIFQALCRKKAAEATIDTQIEELRTALRRCDDDDDEFDEINDKIRKLKKQRRPYLTWNEIAALLKQDKLSKVFCAQFVKRSADSEELDVNGEIRNDMMDKYIQSIMVMYLSSRPSSAAAPETMGLFCTHYPQIAKIELPAAVEEFNNVLSKEDLKITKKDWQHLIQIFMDYTVRSNQSLFLKLSDTNPIDIFACERFATEKPRRRPVKQPKLEPNKMNQSRVVRFLCELLKQDQGGNALEAYKSNYQAIKNVMDALWEDVTREGADLLEISMSWDKDSRCFVRDKAKSDEPYRFNLKNLSFKLYEDVYLCDVNTDSSLHHTLCLRPIENNFKGMAPYLGGNKVCQLKEEWYEKWSVYPYVDTEVSKAQVDDWAKENRKLLWNNGLWGENGVFSNRLTDLHANPNLFIQAEHTAQVDKDVSRTLQADFKEHSINILACSTTMEMGVDLGNLEVVMLTSVPPMPSNYKQRAGRSGRNNKVKSVCITLCGSDAIGLRTLHNPIPSIISRPVCVPMVDLMSPQVVQRHINSYLIRSFGVFKDGDQGGRLTQAVYNYYSNFQGRKDGHHSIIIKADNSECSPNDLMGDKQNTMYEEFNRRCMEPLDDNIKEGLLTLLKGTLYEGKVKEVIDKALEENKRCYKELKTKLEDLSIAFRDATNDKFRTLLRMQYYEVMFERLLNFWATNRFTPNANMPVEVLSLDLNSSSGASRFTQTMSSNPSYGLREAIAQYAPGNSIVVDGVVYVVRGIQFANMYQGARSFKQIYRNSEKCVIGEASSIDGKIRWKANDKEGLELVQPVGFVPDMNEDKSRVIDNNKYTHVNAQLIGTTDWADLVTEPHLFSVRSNREAGYAKILYYNEGIGYGYCLCAKCGRAVIENDVADADDTLGSLSWDMNPKVPKKKNEDGSDKPNYHFAISGKDARKYCVGSNDVNSLRRNVIIGGLIQTDFAEIRLRHKGQKRWMNNRNEEKMLFTLGIVFTQALLDTLGKERGAVDFAIMPNGHICLFDTNPGGAGYSNQLSSVPLMRDVITAAKEMLLQAKARNSKDFLLNKFTLRYIDYIDIDAALGWICEEEEARGILPQEIAAVSEGATEDNIVRVVDAYEASAGESTFFTNDDFERWDYEGLDHGWRNHFVNKLHIKDKKTTLCVVRSSDRPIPEPAVQMLRNVKAGWAKDVVEIQPPFASKDVFPIAYVNGVMYVTNNSEHANLNETWGSQTLYSTRMDNVCHTAKSVDCSYKPNTKIVILNDAHSEQIKTNQLYDLLKQASNGIIDKFIDHCKSSSGQVTISYQDEHLKSVMGMVLTLQTIGGLVREIGKDFDIKFLMEEYEINNYRGTITANLEDNHQRDEMLTNLTEGWLNDLSYNDNIEGKLEPIQSQPYNSLPHWRVLIMECAGKRLSIFPDGGFANGWNFLKDWTLNNKRFTLDNTDTNDIIYLKRSQDIKFDIALEDI